MTVSYIHAAGCKYYNCGEAGRNVGGVGGGVNIFGVVGAALTEFGGLVPCHFSHWRPCLVLCLPLMALSAWTCPVPYTPTQPHNLLQCNALQPPPPHF